MTKIMLQCVSVDVGDGYFYVNFQYTSADLSVQAGGPLNIIVNDASGFEIGKYYDLNLEEVII